jgi:hypothetical protein
VKKMENKTIEQMIYVSKSVPSDKRTAIVYHPESNYRVGRSSPNSEISWYQGTRVYNGEVDLIVKPSRLFRDGHNRGADAPERKYDIERFVDLGSSRYELILANKSGKETFEVDFEKRDVKGGEKNGK